MERMLNDSPHPNPLPAGEGTRSCGFSLHRDGWEQLVLIDSAGRQHVGVDVIRAFPISDPNRGISVCDAEGHEILWIDELGSLPPEIQRLLAEELARRDFMPVIRRIVAVSSEAEPCEWQVETDRGPTSFTLDSEDQVRLVDLHEATVVDNHNIRYLIPDLRRLDAASRRILDRYL
jgi:hypothetical protein